MRRSVVSVVELVEADSVRLDDAVACPVWLGVLRRKAAIEQSTVWAARKRRKKNPGAEAENGSQGTAEMPKRAELLVNINVIYQN
jgi:hypothetical protein